MADDEQPLSSWARMPSDKARMQARVHFDLSHPHVGWRAYDNAMAFVVSILGEAWLAKEIDESRSGGYLLLDGPEDEGDDPSTRYLRQQRMMTLAWELDRARLVRGFSHLVHELQTRSVYEAVAELRAVNHMTRAGQDAWLIDPQATSGPSYDGVVVLSGHEVAVEVKAKLPKPVAEYQPSLILNPLSKARKRQLPASGPSMIYLQIVSPWSDDEDVLNSINTTITQWLRNSRRVNAVVLMLERTYIRENGLRSQVRGTLAIPSKDPHVWVPDLQDWTVVD